MMASKVSTGKEQMFIAMALQRSFESLDNMSGIGMAIQKWSIYKHDLEGNLCKSKFNVWSD